MKCKLTRLTDNGHTRTKEILGECKGPPELGQPFLLIGEALDKSWGADMRLVETTPVMYTTTVFDSPKKIRFMTMNTFYEYEELS